MRSLDATAVVRHLVTWGLSTGPTDPVSLDGHDGLVAAAAFHRVVGVVIDAIESGGAIGVPDGLLDELRRRHLEQLRADVAVEADLVAVSTRLHAAGLEHRVLKGGATAHLDHRDPALRSTSDVDILVRPESLAAAHAAVADLVDPARTVPDRRRRWTERYGKDRTLALQSGGSLDLHRATAPGYHALVRDSDWFDDADSLVIGGAVVEALGRGDRFVHAVAHVGYADEVRLNSLRDVPVLLDRLGDDWESALDRHPASAGLLARGVARTWAELSLGDHRITSWAASVDPSRRERFALRTLDLPGSRPHWGALAALPPWRWLPMLGPVVLPSRAYLRHERRTPIGRLAATVKRVASRR